MHATFLSSQYVTVKARTFQREWACTFERTAESKKIGHQQLPETRATAFDLTRSLEIQVKLTVKYLQNLGPCKCASTFIRNRPNDRSNSTAAIEAPRDFRHSGLLDVRRDRYGVLRMRKFFADKTPASADSGERKVNMEISFHFYGFNSSNLGVPYRSYILIHWNRNWRVRVFRTCENIHSEPSPFQQKRQAAIGR